MLVAFHRCGRGYAALCVRDPAILVGAGPLADVPLEDGFTRLGSTGLRPASDADLLADADSLPADSRRGEAARVRNPAELVSVRGAVADDSRGDERDPHLRRICVRDRLFAGKESAIRQTDLAALFRASENDAIGARGLGSGF